MTTYKSNAVNAGLMPDHAQAGVVNCRMAKYTVSADLSVADVVQMIPVPKNCKILNLEVAVDDATSYGTIDIGDGGSTNRFMDGLSVSGGPYSFFSTKGTSKNAQHKYTAQDTIDVLVADSLLASGTIIYMNAYYKMTGTISDEL